MSGLFSSNNQVNDTTPPASSLRIQTSVLGKCVPVITGQVRLPPNVLDTQDFDSEQVNTGGGGGGAGKGFGAPSCVGLDAPIAAPGVDILLGDIVVGDAIWTMDPATGEKVVGIVREVIEHDMTLSPDGMLAVHVAGMAEALPITTNHYPWLDGVRRREMKDWNIGEALIAFVGGRVPITSIRSVPKPARTRNLVVEPHHNFFAGGVLLHNGGGGGAGKGNTETDYFVAVDYGICEGPISGFIQAWNGQTPVSLASLNLTGFLGTYPGEPWGYMEARHPANALGYAGMATAAAGPMALGTSPNLPNINIECLAVLNSAIAGLPDTDPALWVTDVTTNQFYGVGLPSARLGDLSLYSTFCKANGLVVSDALIEQRALNDYLKDLLAGTYSEMVNVDNALTIIPRGRQAVSGNGFTYTPDDVDYTLSIDDFLPNTNATGTSASSTALNNDPVIWTLQERSQLDNQVSVNCLDRTNDYNPNPQTAQDLAAIEAFGLRAADPNQYSFFMSAAAANTSAHYLLEESLTDKTCCFTLGLKFARVMPMTKFAGVPLPNNAGTTTVLVTEITQNDDFTFSITAEEYPVGAIAPQIYNSENPNPNGPSIEDDPGPVNDPIVFAAPPSLARNQGLEIWCLASPSNPALGGGCIIYGASEEGGPYQRLAVLNGSSTTGVTTADLPVSPDPDTADTLNVDLSQSAGTLEGGTTIDADQGNTLSIVRGVNGDELVSYANATLTAANCYALGGGYLRRGQYNTAIVDHPSGSVFGRIDQNVARIPYQATQIGQTLWLKFLAFNKFGGGGQELGDDEVIAYPVILTAPPPPPDVTGFGAVQNGNVVDFTWDPPAYPALALAGLLLGYAPVGTTDWSDFTILDEVTAGTKNTAASIPPGSWTFGLRAASIAYVPGSSSQIGLSPHIATVDLDVTNALPVISAVDVAPQWLSSVYSDLGNWRDAPVVTVDCGGFITGFDPLAAIIDLGSFS